MNTRLSNISSVCILLFITILQITQVVQAQFFQHMFGGGQAFEQREQEVPPVSKLQTRVGDAILI